MPTMWRTGSTSGATSAFDTRVTALAFDEAKETLACRDGRRPMLLGPVLHHGGRLPLRRPTGRISTGSTSSRARCCIPASGRMSRWTSPAGASRSSARAPRRSRRFRSSPRRRRRSRSSSARRTMPCPPGTGRSTRSACAPSRPTIRAFAPRPVRGRPASISPTTPARPSTRRRNSAAASTRSSGGAAGCPSSAPSATCCSTRRPTTRPPSLRARRSAPWSTIRQPRNCFARTTCSAASGSASIPATTRPTIWTM